MINKSSPLSAWHIADTQQYYLLIPCLDNIYVDMPAFSEVIYLTLLILILGILRTIKKVLWKQKIKLTQVQCRRFLAFHDLSSDFHLLYNSKVMCIQRTLGFDAFPGLATCRPITLEMWSCGSSFSSQAVPPSRGRTTNTGQCVLCY